MLQKALELAFGRRFGGRHQVRGGQRLVLVVDAGRGAGARLNSAARRRLGHNGARR